jgi:hypothetical protein
MIPINPFPPGPITREQAAMALLKAGFNVDQVTEFLKGHHPRRGK